MLNTSNEINEIAAALCQAQGEMSGASKNAKNVFFKSTYSDLESVIAAIRGPFAAHGLSFVQAPHKTDLGEVAVTTRIMHVSGQWLESTIVLTPVQDKPQDILSAVTYGKRGGLQAMVGLPSVDDDGNQAQQAAPEPVDEVDIGKYTAWCERAAQDGLETLQEQWQALAPAVRKQLGRPFLNKMKARATEIERNEDALPEAPEE